MKLDLVLVVIFYFILLSCHSKHNEKINDKENFNEKKTLIDTEKLTDEELVNMSSKLLMEAGGTPISKEDTLKLKKALYYLDRAIKKNNRNEAAYTNMITILCMLKNYQEALNLLKKESSLKENFAEGYSYQGFIYEKLGVFDTAQIMYKKAIQSYNDRLKQRSDINDEINRAMLLFFIKGKEDALKEIENIIKNNPDNAYANNMRYIFENFDKKKFLEKTIR